MEDNKYIIKNIQDNLTKDSYEFISGHFEREIIFPGVVLLQLIIETIFQWFLKQKQKHLSAYSLKEANFKNIVKKNSRMDLFFSYVCIKKTYQVYAEILVSDITVMSTIIEFQDRRRLTGMEEASETYIM